MKRLLISCMFALLTIFPCQANGYPDHPITVINAGPAGGLLDLPLRVACSMLSKEIGQPIINTNITGGEGGVAINTGLKAEHDGYTLLGIDSSYITFTPYYKNARYGFEDFRILGAVAGQGSGIITQADRPWKDLNEAFEWAKKEDKRLIVGYVMGQDKYNVETCLKQANVKYSLVPQKGGAACLTGILGGHLDIATIGLLGVENTLAGKIKMLACCNVARFTRLPDVPTLRELGYNINHRTYNLLVGPADMPEEAALLIEKALAKVIQSEEYRTEVFDKIGMEPVNGNLEEDKAILKEISNEIKAQLAQQK